MYTAEIIANWFIVRDGKNTDSEGISNLKIQKLLYYAQGASLALTSAPLFEDNICAWEHGPVVAKIYHKYKSYGASPIPVGNSDMTDNIDSDTARLLEEVYTLFGQYSAWKLRDMTHGEDPWKKTKLGDTISLGLIKSNFQQNYVEE